MAQEDKDLISEKVKDFLEKINKEKGLTSEKVEESRREFGQNILSPPPRKPLWLQFLEEFEDPTIILLSVAAVISIFVGFYRGHFIEGIGIIIAIVLATGVSFYSEYKSNKEFELLNKISEDTAKVRRNGEVKQISSREVVVGDLVILDMGDKIPADGKLVETTDLYVNQSMLTGESEPVQKDVGRDEPDNRDSFPRNMVFKGTMVTDGSGVIIVTSIGDRTEMGRIAGSISEEKEIQTPLQQRLEILSRQIGYVGASFAVFIFLSLLAKNYLLGNISSWNIITFDYLIKYFMIAVTIIVVAIPEGLPMMVTMSLALNMRKLAASNCLVKKLEASETVGAMTVVCTDKTGTLTQNRMKPVWFYLSGNVFKRDELEQHKQKEWEQIKLNSAVNSTAHIEKKDDEYMPIGNVTEAALLGMLKDHGIDYEELREKHKVVRQIPFSSERKKMITIIGSGQEKEKLLCLTKGAPEVVLENCSSILINGEQKPIEEYLEKINQSIDDATGNAYRVLGFSQKFLTGCDEEKDCCDDEKDNVFLGLVGISDPLRENAADSIQSCYNAGIDVKMLTGDDIKTAEAIARECRILQNEDDISLTHRQFKSLSDDELNEKLVNLKVLARSKPEDKLRLVKALEKHNEVVGVTGDGINDAPALNYADVGISMGKTGTEVAKEASDIVLLDDNFKSIVSGILWGRTIYENIQRLVQFQLTVNFVALLVAFLGPFLGVDLPLTVIQLLWVNIIMDTFAALALSAEPPRKGTMSKPPRPRNEHIISPSMAGYISITGVFMTTVLLILLKTNFLGGANEAQYLTILFTTFVMFQFWNEFNCRSLEYGESPFENITQNRMFLIIVSIIFVVQILVVNYGGELFRTVPISIDVWLKIIILTATVLPVGHFAKWIVHKFIRKPAQK
ncbi:MAG: calcium-translocating P-type ATPase, PMCA-type [Vulcanimicrobiota bacterium]